MPTPRWFSGPAHQGRVDYFNSRARFTFNHSGRRSWKTETAKRRMICRAIATPGRYLSAAPTNKQAKRIFWDDYKRFLPRFAVNRIYEGEMFIRLQNGSELHVAGMDAPDRVEGQLWNWVALDEYGNMAARVWPEVISPVLADTHGGCDFIGVPEGRNHYYNLMYDPERGMNRRADTAIFHWPSWEILDAAEIETQKQNMDDLTFRQEFGGEFVTFSGRAYYPFDRETHCADLSAFYRPQAGIVFCFDFNVDPGVAVVCQEGRLPNGQNGTGVIGEVFIPKNSNTEAVCRKLIEDWSGIHKGRVFLYGDFTGGQRGSAKLHGSDWTIIERMIRSAFGGENVIKDVPPNPAVKARINSVNARLKNAKGDIRMMVDIKRAPHVVADLEGVALLQGSAGEIDKKSSAALTHVSDALGYYIHRAYPIGGSAGVSYGNLF